MATYFISDLHLSPKAPQVVSGLLAFLNGEAAGADALYLLGDVFDAWLGDDDDAEAVAQLLGILRRFTDHGVPTYFVHGNRDFLVGERFAAATGIHLLPETTVVDLYDHRALIMHGDTLCTGDSEYLKFRAMVRNPAWQQQVLALPLPDRRQMAAKLRADSQSMNAMKAADIMDVTQSEVLRVMEEAHVDLLIHGHTHRPAVHEFTLNDKPAQRIVLGDWHEQGWFLKAYENGALELVNFPLTRQTA